LFDESPVVYADRPKVVEMAFGERYFLKKKASSLLKIP